MKKVILFLFLFSCVSYSQLRKKVTATSTPMTSGQVQDSLNADSLVLTKPFSVGNGGVYLVNTWMDTMNVNQEIQSNGAYLQTKTITGVAIGDFVTLSFPSIPDFVLCNGFVSDANTVTIQWENVNITTEKTITNVTYVILVQRFVKP